MGKLHTISSKNKDVGVNHILVMEKNNNKDQFHC